MADLTKIGKSGGLHSFEQVSSIERLIINLILSLSISLSLSPCFDNGTFNIFVFQVKDIFLYPEQFSVENGLLTPTFKAKRHELKAKFKVEIDDMYKNLV